MQEKFYKYSACGAMMKEIRSNVKILPLLAFGVTLVSGLCALHIQEARAKDFQSKNVIATENERILPSQVTRQNLQTFEDQFRKDLPIGTAKKDVDSYLVRYNFPQSFSGPDHEYKPEANSYFIQINDIGYRWIVFAASLKIKIYLDDDDKIRDIVFHVFYDGL